jgi:hypothetical protein
MNFSVKRTFLTIFSLFLFIFAMINHGTAHAYYGLYGNTYSAMYGLGSSLYGGGLSTYTASPSILGTARYYGLGGAYAGLSSLYGLAGPYGAGLYGAGPYGAGLYGAGLYGAGLYGAGLYGSIYGGMYGLGGLYGTMYGSSGFYGGLGGTRYGLAEQAGSWQGLWSTVTSSGDMTLSIVEGPTDPTLLSGVVQLIGNTFLRLPIDVTGELINNQVILTGTCPGLGNWPTTINLKGTLISATEMAGNYTLTKSVSVIESGTFDLTLTTPVL